MTRMQSLLRTLLVIAMLAALAPARAQTVRVVTENTPYSFLQGGKVAGGATTVLEMALRNAGLDYRVDVYPWARAYDMALREPNVLIYLIARTPEREKRFQWAGEFMRMRYHLYALPDRADVQVGSLDEARKYVIGVVRDDVRQQYLVSRNFTRLTVSAQPPENLRKLLFRQVDMVALTEGEAESLCQDLKPDCPGLRLVYTLDEMSTSLYMAYSLATPATVVDRTRTAFEVLRANGTLTRFVDTSGRRPVSASTSPSAVPPAPPPASPAAPARGKTPG